MNTIFILTLASIILGAAGGVLRAFSLTSGLEPVTGLPIEGYPAQTALIIISVLVIVISIFALIKNKNAEKHSFEQVFGGKDALFQTLSVISGMIFMVSGAMGLFFALKNPVYQSKLLQFTTIPQWVLAILCGISIIAIIAALSKGNLTSSNAYFALIPMFWGAFDLIVCFQKYSTSPFISLYAFELLAPIFISYAFYIFAGLLYSEPKPSRLIFSGISAIFFSLVCGIGGFITMVINNDFSDISQICRYGCLISAALWLIAVMIRISGTQNKTEETP